MTLTGTNKTKLVRLNNSQHGNADEGAHDWLELSSKFWLWMKKNPN